MEKKKGATLAKSKANGFGLSEKVLNQLPTTVMAVDKNMKLVYINNAGLKLVGKEIDEVLGVKCADIFNSKHCDTSDCCMAKAMENGNCSARNEININGDIIPIEYFTSPLKDEKGEIIGGLEYIIDITETVKHENHLLEQQLMNAEFEGRINAIDKSQGTIEFSMDGTIIDANENFLNVLGYSLEDVKGKHHRIFCEESYAKSPEYKEFWEKLNRGEFDAGEYKRIGKNGKEVFIQATYNPIFDLNGKPIKILKIATDITEQKRLESERIKQAELIMEMSTPVMQLWDGILMLPIVGLVDSKRVQLIMETVLQRIIDTQAKVVILDIQGVPNVDSAVANHLIKITKASRLMGCVCIITGISPEISQALVNLGIELTDILTQSTLKDGLNSSLQSIGCQIKEIRNN
jgi:methyl-accepting chemotaxis protein